MLLEGTNINLIEITKEYTPLIVEWRNRKNIIRNFIFQNEFTPETHNKWIDENIATGKAVQFIITIKSSGKPIGCVFLKNINTEAKDAEFGIFIGEDEARGKGYGAEATGLICRYGFTLGLEKILLRVLSTNLKAIESYKKSGFTIENILEKELYRENTYIDVIIMSLTKSVL